MAGKKGMKLPPRKMRALTVKNILRYIRHKENVYDQTMTFELRKDQSGSLVNSVSKDIIDAWEDLTELNICINDATREDEKPNGMPNFRKFNKTE